jgi:hypothetical protein
LRIRLAAIIEEGNINLYDAVDVSNVVILSDSPEICYTIIFQYQFSSGKNSKAYPP